MGRPSYPHTSTKPTKPRKEREQPTKQKHGETAGAGQTHKQQHATKTKEEKKGAGRQHKTGGEHKNQRGCSSALTDAQWGSWIIADEYLSEEAQSTPTTYATWCRGYKTPHRATAFDATGRTKSRNKALQHAKQNARQPSRTQGNDTWREAPVSTWTRQPRGVVQMGGGGHQHTTAQQEQTKSQDKEKHNGSVLA